MLTKLDKKIVRPFDIASIQHYADNKNLITVQDMLESGKDCLTAPYGMIVGAHNGELIYQDVETHGIVIGNTGSGKTSSAAIPNLLSHRGSVVSLEIGGNTLRNTYNYRKFELGQNIYVFDPHNIIGLGSSNYNPMDDLDPTEPDFYSRILTMSSALISDADGNKEQNPYFRENPSGLIAAMVVYLKLANSSLVSDKQRNFRSLAQIFSKFPSEDWNKHITALKEWNGPHESILNKFGHYLSTAQPGDQNVRSVVTATSQWLDKWMADTSLGQHIVSSDFSMMDLRNKKTTIYIVMPSVVEYINYQPWLRLILQSAIDGTPNPGDGGKNFTMEDRILFMIDELTQLGHLQVVTTGAQTVRQKGITLWSLFQDYGSLRAVYGEDRASAFLGSAEAIQFFRSHEDRTLEYISKHLGRSMVYVPSVTEGQMLQIGVGEQKSVAKGKAKQTTRQETKSNSVTEIVQETDSTANTRSAVVTETYKYEHPSRSPYDTSSEASSSGDPSPPDGSDPSLMSYAVSNGNATTTGHAKTTGQSIQEGIATSIGSGTVDSETNQDGTNTNETYGMNYALVNQPIIIEGKDFRETKGLLSGKSQILLTNGKAGSHCTLDNQARYYDIPLLKERAEGPPLPKAPAFPNPPEKTVVRLTHVPPVNLEDFKLDASKLNWKPEDLVRWTPPTELSEWGQGVKDTRAAYEAAQYRLNTLDETAGFFQKFFRNPIVQVATAVSVVTTCCIGKSVAAAGITFGALMLTGIVSASWQRHKLVRVKMDRWKDYTNMRGAAITAVRNQLTPIMATQDANEKLMNETVQRQKELVAGKEKMEAVLTDRHESLEERIEEHRINLEKCHQAFQDIRSGASSGWSSGDWAEYVRKLERYQRVREKFFNFDKRDYLVAPTLVTPSKLGSLPPRTLFSKTSPMPEFFEAEPLTLIPQQEEAFVPTQGTETRKQLQAYFDTELVGYDLPDDIKTVGDALTRRTELAGSDKRRDRRAVMQLDAALESVEDPSLEKFDGLVRGYASGLRLDEDAYTQLLRQQIREGQRNVMETIEKIRQFNGQAMRLDEAQVGFGGFTRRLDEVLARAHHRAHVRAIRKMDDLEQTFEEQSDRLVARGPLVPPKQPRKRQELKDAQPSK